jgi:hypothetical protein
MKYLKLFEEFTLPQDYKQDSIPFDEEIADELRKLFKGSKVEKYGLMEDTIKRLLDLHRKWIDMGKKLYGTADIARRLYQYQKNIER